jgi:hypothetical protein
MYQNISDIRKLLTQCKQIFIRMMLKLPADADMRH